MKIDNTPPEILDRIRDKKAELGDELLILTHHYQRRAIVDLGDFKGDSFCPNMYKISPAKLLETLERPGKNRVTVPKDVQAGALLALERMLALPA